MTVKVNVFKDHRQTIQYILPTDHQKLAQAELVAIDEAAAIPLPTVKKLLGPYLVFISSTVNGYEGTGRALSLKLIQQLRTQQSASVAAAAQQAGASVAGDSKMRKGEKKLHENRWKVAAEAAANYASLGGGASGSSSARILTEITLETPIRYAVNDPVEKWLNGLLCLDVLKNSTRIVSSLPAPKDCELYFVDRDALFSYHSLAEQMLQRIWALYTSAHYKNSPNDLQMLSDAPAHRLFVLLGPQRAVAASAAASGSSGKPPLPDILCVLQVAFEGRISQKSVQSELAKGNKASGDMIPWTISQQYNDTDFASLSGARIVRIATHPDVQNMGYGSRAVELLLQYFQGEIMCTDPSRPVPRLGEFGGESGVPSRAAAGGDGSTLLGEEVAPRSALPPLLTQLHERPAERLHWLGVSFGLTSDLLTFWSRKRFKVSYLRQTPNDLTGEFSCIALRELQCSDLPNPPQDRWLEAYVADYRKRLVSLMAYSFRELEASLAITLLDPDKSLTMAGGDADDAAPSSSSGSSSGGHSASLSSSSGGGGISIDELLSAHLTQYDLKRLELYARNMVDHHMIIDLVPTLTRLLFLNRFVGIRFGFLQIAILICIGLQYRDVDSVARELDLPVNQVLAFFNKSIRKLTMHMREKLEAAVAREEMPTAATISRLERRAQAMTSLSEGLREAQEKDAEAYSSSSSSGLIKQTQKNFIMQYKDLSMHAVDGSVASLLDREAEALVAKSVVPSVVSVKKAAKRDAHDDDGGDGDGNGDHEEGAGEASAKKEKKQKKHKKINHDDEVPAVHMKKKHKH